MFTYAQKQTGAACAVGLLAILVGCKSKCTGKIVDRKTEATWQQSASEQFRASLELQSPDRVGVEASVAGTATATQSHAYSVEYTITDTHEREVWVGGESEKVQCNNVYTIVDHEDDDLEKHPGKDEDVKYGVDQAKAFWADQGEVAMVPYSRWDAVPARALPAREVDWVLSAPGGLKNGWDLPPEETRRGSIRLETRVGEPEGMFRIRLDRRMVEWAAGKMVDELRLEARLVGPKGILDSDVASIGIPRSFFLSILKNDES